MSAPTYTESRLAVSSPFTAFIPRRISIALFYLFQLCIFTLQSYTISFSTLIDVGSECTNAWQIRHCDGTAASFLDTPSYPHSVANTKLDEKLSQVAPILIEGATYRYGLSFCEETETSVSVYQPSKPVGSQMFRYSRYDGRGLVFGPVAVANQIIAQRTIASGDSDLRSSAFLDNPTMRPWSSFQEDGEQWFHVFLYHVDNDRLYSVFSCRNTTIRPEKPKNVSGFWGGYVNKLLRVHFWLLGREVAFQTFRVFSTVDFGGYIGRDAIAFTQITHPRAYLTNAKTQVRCTGAGPLGSIMS